MVDKTPIKIIAAIVIPLVIALVVRFVILDDKKKPDATGSPEEQVNLLDLGDDSSVNIVTTWLLPDELLEVSGITWLDADHFACVQDEKGVVFIYNVRLNKIDKEIPFGPDGDYEGIAEVENSLFILRADGVLFDIENYASDKPAVKMYRTPLGKKQDSESLAYDEKNKRLLVAVKADDPKSSDYKGIYAFDLKTRSMSATPVYKLNLADPIFDTVNNGKPKNAISPSDIDIHPLTGDIYILEGTKPKLLIMGENGDLKSVQKLKGADFPQPEGLSFSPDGKLYISNEGNKSPGNILHVELLTK